MNPLEQLKDLHSPADPSWWPLAWGWWVLALLVIILLTYVAVTWQRRRRLFAPIREAKLALANLSLESQQYASDCNQLIKRVAITYNPDASALYGEQWLNFLVDTSKAKARSKIHEGFMLLQRHLYQNSQCSKEEALQIQAATSLWLSNVRPRALISQLSPPSKEVMDV